MKRVVPVFGFERDFDVVVAPAVTVQDLFYLAAKVAFDFQDNSPNAPLGIMRFVGEDLLGIRVHAAGGFAAPHGAENCNPREEAPLRNFEPMRGFGRAEPARVMHFADNDKEVVALAGIGIPRKESRDDSRTELERSDIQSRKNSEKHNIRRREKTDIIYVAKAQEG